MSNTKVREFKAGFFQIKEDSPEELKRFSQAFGSGQVQQYELKTVNIVDIALPESQPRKYFDDDALQALSDSIRIHGVIEPLVVRSLGQECYELIAGERRLRASRMAGLARVPEAVMNINREQATELALIENLQREDLNPVEETEAVLGLISLKFDIGRDDAIAALYSLNNKVTTGSNHNVMVREDDLQKLFDSLGCGKWQSFVKNRLPLLKLPTDILEALCSGKIAYTKALVITRVKDEEARKHLLNKATEQNLSLSVIRQEVKSLLAGDTKVNVGLTFSAKKSLKLIQKNITRSNAWNDCEVLRILQECDAKMNDYLNRNKSD
ncbi:MAG: ParB/RepB/Spo0J family partition protein [Symploca sp. SIO3C6]|nr:ParB/RepB/Spo0J family partition protein [Symploca sp. SIO3C6]